MSDWPRLALAVFLVIVVAGCQTMEEAPRRPTRIGNGVFLSLPPTPGYPRRETLIQTIVGEYQGERRLFQSVVSLSPERVRLVITAPSGPRVLTVAWSADGIAVERSALAPRELNADSILADLMLVYWDLASVNAALAGSASAFESDGTRTVVQGERAVVTVDRRNATAEREQIVLTNRDLGYALRIQTVRTAGT